MIKSDIVNTVLMLPPILVIEELNVDDKRSSIEALFESVQKDILISFDWPFAIKEATENSVEGQASYQLKGEDDDARQIINLRFGSDNKLLDKRRLVDMDEYLEGRTISSVTFWIEDGFFDGFPKVRLVSSPTSTGETITYRYRAKEIALSSFPSEFEQAFIYGIAAVIAPSYLVFFNKALDRLIDSYNYGGGEDDQVKQDPVIIYKNNRRSIKFGYGG